MVVKILITIALATSLCPADTHAQTATPYDFALFNSSKASWQSEVEALKSFLRATNQSFEEIDARMIQSGHLNLERHRALLIPGGLVGNLSHELAATGAENIRRFIQAGGGYLGICAGAAIAASQFEVALEPNPQKGLYKPNDYFNTRYPHLLGLWPGEARSPYAWAPFQEGARIERVSLTKHAPLAAGSSTNTQMFYLAGPSLPIGSWAINGMPRGFEAWGLLEPPDGIDIPPTRRAAIVKFQYGQGSVVLFAHHPIIPVADGRPVDFVSQPETLEKAMSRAPEADQNWTNWNLLKSAMQAVTRMKPEALKPKETLLRMGASSKRCERLFQGY
ncbi:MAG: BPL-N domain-containing protein [Bdellovibrionales bacterium]|nr:BPL-N domain-containing protein [Bdellovibrionales bacterium]